MFNTRLSQRFFSFALVAAMIGFAITAMRYKPLMVLSGSMGKAIPVGALAFGQEVPQASIAVGDVIMVVPKSKTTPYIHRVIRIYEEAGQVFAQTQGDASASVDPHPYALTSKVMRVDWNIPYLGYASQFMASPKGWAAFIVLWPLMIFMLKGRSSEQKPETVGKAQSAAA